MFIATMLSAFPEHASETIRVVERMFSDRGVQCTLHPHNDSILNGFTFSVELAGSGGRHLASIRHEHAPGHSHDHVHWSDIRARLRQDLPAAIAKHAVSIFELLAQAEGKVHGVPPSEVVFHEVGAWDSIADIVGAAYLIDVISASWTVSAIPIGGGRIKTAHGIMPVPAPATALLLEGFDMVDDGVPGERVTPTGAAILKYLCRGEAATNRVSGKLSRSGLGFGTRKLDGISNCVRALVFDDTRSIAPTGDTHRQLAVIEFEVDDQSAEDLAMGLSHLRAHEHIFDVVQSAVFGKKGRMATSVRVLASPGAIDAVLDACFRETTTIGLRYHLVHGAALARRAVEVDVDGERVRVKSVERPGGISAKAEADDVMARQDHAQRMATRTRAVQAALTDKA
ncbi:LarC family nickel insertion protein [Burkholderia sp. PAMC 26561]|nr:LarC family nickel insertion protein [Burkholderia sp. PAMC 26561]